MSGASFQKGNTASPFPEGVDGGGGVGELFVVNRASLRSPSVDFNRIILIS